MAKQNQDILKARILELLCCPQDHSALKLMTKRSMNALAKKIDAGAILNGRGEVVTQLPAALLVREDRRVGYPVREGVALLNARDAITLKR